MQNAKGPVNTRETMIERQERIDPESERNITNTDTLVTGRLGFHLDHRHPRERGDIVRSTVTTAASTNVGEIEAQAVIEA
jgi:hypothetical protein